MEEASGTPGEGGRAPADQRAGCGVTGCLIAAAVLFVALLSAMVLLALTHTWIRPVVP